MFCQMMTVCKIEHYQSFIFHMNIWKEDISPINDGDGIIFEER